MIQDFRDEKILHRRCAALPSCKRNTTTDRLRTSRYAFVILLRMKALITALPTVVDVPVPEGSHITVCGDVHGQFYDLLNIFELNGLPSDDHPYLFNGASGAALSRSRAAAAHVAAAQETLWTAGRFQSRSSSRSWLSSACTQLVRIA
jgi:hypothetical protein